MIDTRYTYSETGLLEPVTETYRVTVRVDGREIVCVVAAGVDSPMGTAQAVVAEELGIETYQVVPVTYETVKAQV